MNAQQLTEEQLWNYIDGSCNAAEKAMIEELCNNNPQWQKRYNELLELHQLMHENIEPDQPSMRFTKNVMDEIAKSRIAPAARTYINKKIIYGIAAFFILIISGFLIYGFTQVEWKFSGSSDYTINISRYFNNTLLNIFMLLNILLALVLFDRYIRRKKNESAHKEG